MVQIINEKNLPSTLKNLEEIKNNIIHGDTLSFLKKIPEKSVNLIVTSPSYYTGKEYEEFKSFGDYLEKHEEIIKECYRVLKDNGAIFWNVAQTPIDGEIIPLGAIFYNIFKKHNFFLKNWIIWKFEGGETPRKRFFGRYENILWFVKNKDNYIFNLDSVRIPSKWISDKRCNPNGKNPEDFWVFDERKNFEKIKTIKSKILKYNLIFKQKSSQMNQALMNELIRDIEIELDNLINMEEMIKQRNLFDPIWHINRVVNISKSQKIKHPLNGKTHPCPFPEKMVERIIKVSTNKGDFILDIFNGSGTTCKVAQELERDWIGIDKEKDYCEIALKRVTSVI